MPNFDRQAATFDARAGLSEPVARQLAAALIEYAGLRPGDPVFEVGAGTGEIGIWLCRAGLRYRGIDLSGPMLEVFRRGADELGVVAELSQADANEPWPVDDGSVRLIFGSRSLHLLDPEHVVAEAFRAAAPEGAVLCVGRRERDDDSLRRRIRQKMRHLLAESGIQGRDNEAGSRTLLRACRERGAVELPERIAVVWQAAHTARAAIDAWRGKEGLAGVDVPPAIKSRILNQLETWADQTFGDLDAPIESQEQYILHGVRIQPS